MKVFISWSGERSREVAKILKRWIERNIQSADTWISTDDIGAGELWFQEIKNQLDESSVGIVCLTKENVGNPWILFEAGALAKGTKENKVCTFLVDLKPTDLQAPLSHFNATSLEKTTFKKLVKTISDGLEKPLSDSVIDDIMESAWDKLKSDIDQIVAQTTTGPTPAKISIDDAFLELIRLATQNNHALAKQQNDIVELTATVRKIILASPEWPPLSRFLQDRDPTASTLARALRRGLAAETKEKRNDQIPDQDISGAT